MKRILATMALMTAIALSASAMTYSQARDEALYLTDKMAFELRLSSEQMAAVYEINLDYLLCLGSSSDLYGIYWTRRNNDLRYVLTAYQYDLYTGAAHFYRPVSWRSGAWTFSIYSRYSNRNYFYYNRPAIYDTYRGGNNKLATSHYANRNFNQPKGSGHGVGNWRHDGPGNGHPGGTTTTTRTYTGTTGHGSTSRSQNGNTNWRQNATKPATQGNTRTTTTTTTRSTTTSTTRTGSGNFGGSRK